MPHIGQKIKELRLKNAMTQDRLADYLGVTSQAVSKWECEASMPDLTLIVPLTRVLRCTADELLGIIEEDNDDAEALSREIMAMRSHPEEVERLRELVAEAARRFPRNEKISYRIAETEYWISQEVSVKTENQQELKKDAEKRLLSLAADGKSETWRTCAASLLFRMRMNDGRRDEAKIFAEQSGSFRDMHLLECLEGEDWLNQQQFLVYKSLNWLCNYLSLRGERNGHLPSFVAIEAAVKAIVNDGNYIGYSLRLSYNAAKQVELLLEAGEFERAVRKLREQLEYDEQRHRIVRIAAEDPERELPYTAPALDHWCEGAGYLIEREDAARWANENWREERAQWLKNAPAYAPLRDRPDFQALLHEFTESKKD